MNEKYFEIVKNKYFSSWHRGNVLGSLFVGRDNIPKNHNEIFFLPLEKQTQYNKKSDTKNSHLLRLKL